VKGSFLNLWILLLGGSQKKLPKSNFPRFLLAKFLIFTLVIRSLYQGAIFKLLKQDIRTIELNSIDDLIENEFTFYIYESLAVRLRGSKFMKKHEVITLREIEKYEEKTLDSSFKGVVFGYLLIVLYKNIQSRKNYTLNICKEVMLTNQIVFYFTKNFYLVDEFNRVIDNVKAAGLVDHVLSKYIDEKMINAASEKQGPSPLDLVHLSGIFKLLAGGLITALLSFLMEIFIFKLREKIRKKKKSTKIKLFELNRNVKKISK
jgi:hypothetical protein